MEFSFLPSTVRNTFQSHVIDTWYVGPSTDHYRKMFFDNLRTGYCTNSGTYKLFLTYSRMPTISKNDHTIMAATDLLEMSKQILPVSASQKKKPLHNIAFTHQSSYWAPNAEGEQVDTQTNGIHTTFEGGSSINFEGGYNTNFEGGQYTNHMYWPNGARSHLHNPAYPSTTNEEQCPATINAKPGTCNTQSNASCHNKRTNPHNGYTNNPTRS